MNGSVQNDERQKRYDTREKKESHDNEICTTLSVVSKKYFMEFHAVFNYDPLNGPSLGA